MSIDLKNAGAGFTRLHFWLLFPGFFLYQAALGYQLVPQIPGGYFGLTSVVGFPFLLLVYLSRAERHVQAYTLSDSVFAALVVLIVITALVNYAAGWNDSTELLVWSLSGLLFNLTGYLVAQTVDLGGGVFRKVLNGSLAVMIAIVFFGASQGSFDLSSNSGPTEGLATYQSLARSLVVVGLVAFAINEKGALKTALFVGTLVALFLNGARTELIMYVLAIAVYTLFVSASSPTRLLLWLIAALGGGIAGLTYLQSIMADLPHSRMDELFDIWNSSSGLERQYYSNLAFEQIARSPVFGDYGGYLSYGGVGSYAHNLLSAWVNLGIVGFFLYIIALSAISYGSFRFVMNNKQAGVEWTLAALFAFSVTLALIASKDYSYMLFGLALGFYSRAARETCATPERQGRYSPQAIS